MGMTSWNWEKIRPRFDFRKYIAMVLNPIRVYHKQIETQKMSVCIGQVIKKKFI